ncbi:MAG: hypothetical protein IJD13_03830 [Oscillospiraceae bacterium]|nr:hypothetical protein [Oscillospiraceae bacterium]
MIVRNASGGGGVKLPVLTNPADAAQVLKGYEFINPETGEAATGAALSTVISATAANVENGKTYYDHTGALKTGTATMYKLTSGSLSLQSSSNTTAVSFTGTLVAALVYCTVSGVHYSAAIDNTITAIANARDDDGTRILYIQKNGNNINILPKQTTTYYYVIITK